MSAVRSSAPSPLGSRRPPSFFPTPRTVGAEAPSLGLEVLCIEPLDELYHNTSRGVGRDEKKK